MFGIGFPELILILALALIVIGPDKLPDFARSIAKTLVDLRRTAEGLKNSFDAEDNPLTEIKPQLEDAAKNFRETILDAEKATVQPLADLAELDPDKKPAQSSDVPVSSNDDLQPTPAGTQDGRDHSSKEESAVPPAQRDKPSGDEK